MVNPTLSLLLYVQCKICFLQNQLRSTDLNHENYIYLIRHYCKVNLSRCWRNIVLSTCVCPQVCFQVGAFEVCFPTVRVSADMVASPRWSGFRHRSVCGWVVDGSRSDGRKLQTTWRCLFRGQNYHDWTFGHHTGHKNNRRLTNVCWTSKGLSEWKRLENWWHASRRRIGHHCSRGWWGIRSERLKVYCWVTGALTQCIWCVADHTDGLRSGDPWPLVLVTVGTVRWSYARHCLK